MPNTLTKKSRKPKGRWMQRTKMVPPVRSDHGKGLYCVIQSFRFATLAAYPNPADRTASPRRAFGPQESFIQRAQRLVCRGRVDAALDLVYDSIDALLRLGRYAAVDGILSSTAPVECSTDILLGLLTATLSARSKLHFRTKFFSDVSQVVTIRPEYEEGLLTGLN